MYANPLTLVPYEAVKDETLKLKLAAFVSSHHFRIAKELHQVRDYHDTRCFLADAFSNRGQLLEIGSGTGSLLDFFRADGWEVEGVDPWKEGCQYARVHYDITCHATTLRQVQYPSCWADAVLMIHVIEHLRDPLGELHEIYRVLKPGGVLMVETPCYDTLTFRLLGRRERSISHNSHIFFFVPNTLRRMGESAGLRSLRLHRVGRSLTVSRLLWNLGVISKSSWVQRRLVGFADRVGLQGVSLHVNVGDMQRMFFEKPAH